MVSFLIFFYSIFSWSETTPKIEKDILIRSSIVNHQQYDNFIQTHPEFTSFKNFWLDGLQKKFIGIEHKYKRASSEFFLGSFSEARHLFKSIVQQAHSFDWNLNSRQIINYSYFRLAQLEDDKFEKWIKLAYYFDSSIPPDSQNFPPPFQKMWEDLKKESSRIDNLFLWRPSFDIGKIDYIFVNGREFNYYQFEPIELSPENNRITLIGNNGFVETLIGIPRKIINYKWKTNNLAQGNCAQPNVSALDFTEYKFSILYEDNCVRHFYQGHILPLTFKPESKLDNFSTKDSPHFQFNNFSQNKNKSYFSSKSKTWIWLGVAVGSFIVYEQIRRNQNSSELNVQVSPSHRKGP